MDFAHLIIEWYRDHMRDLPWRHTSDPYRIWVSEIILQQTRVAQGMAYYDRFLERFPDVDSLALAEEEDVMKTWQGLGYYSRARNMHESAKMVAKEHDSRFPVSYDELRKLKGIGDYSASAISSIAGGERQPVVDGNVLRVISRYRGIEESVNTTAGRKKVKDYLYSQIDPAEPGTFNQAMMELGALVCKPRQPVCPECPVRAGCVALRDGRTAELPVLNKAKPSRTRYFHYVVIIGGKGDERYTWLNKRSGTDIWKNLYDFPLIEADTRLDISELERTDQWKSIFSGTGYTILPDLYTDHHILSHQELRVMYVQVLADLDESLFYVKTPIKDIHKYPVSRMIEKYFKKVGW
jgi:A/G-specific adenine glycosylase